MTIEMSGDISELAVAMVKCQSQIEGAAKDNQNPFLKNKYADLASVWHACRDALVDNGFCVLQPGVILADGSAGLRTLLLHKSGQWLSGIIPLVWGEEKGLKPMQAMGSALTYARRYGLAALVGVLAEDDDGNSSGNGKGKPPPPTRGREDPPPAPPPPPPPQKLPAEADVWAKALRAASNMDELGTAWTGTPRELRGVLSPVKDEMKKKLNAPPAK